MRTYLLMLCCMFFAVTVHATCNSNLPASTPNGQLIDNGDGTITDLATGLMWKQCVEGLSGSDCLIGTFDGVTWQETFFTWQEALQQPGVVNNAGGFAGYTDWRLPNIRELDSLVEEQCHDPAINATRFPNTPGGFVWTGSPNAFNSDFAWVVDFGHGGSSAYSTCARDYSFAVRLVRGGN